MFFPGMPAAGQRALGTVAGLVLRRRFGISAERNRTDQELARRAARVALDRLAGVDHGVDHLVRDRLSLADITLATMTAPLQYGGRAVRDDPDVQPLLEWGARVLGNDFSPLGPPAAARA